METVNHPKHYNAGKIEVIEFLEDQFMDRPHEWNAVKYIARAPHKGREIEDLEKAIWYLKRKIELLKAAQTGEEPLRPNAMNDRRTPAELRSPSSFYRRPSSATDVSNLNPIDEETASVRVVHPECDDPACVVCNERAACAEYDQACREDEKKGPGSI